MVLDKDVRLAFLSARQKRSLSQKKLGDRQGYWSLAATLDNNLRTRALKQSWRQRKVLELDNEPWSLTTTLESYVQKFWFLHQGSGDRQGLQCIRGSRALV